MQLLIAETVLGNLRKLIDYPFEINIYFKHACLSNSSKYDNQTALVLIYIH